MSLGGDGSRLTAILASGLLNPFPSLAQLPKFLQAPVECKVVDHGPNRLPPRICPLEPRRSTLWAAAILLVRYWQEMRNFQIGHCGHPFRPVPEPEPVP